MGLGQLSTVLLCHDEEEGLCELIMAAAHSHHTTGESSQTHHLVGGEACCEGGTGVITMATHTSKEEEGSRRTGVSSCITSSLAEPA